MADPKQTVRACYDAVSDVWSKDRGEQVNNAFERQWLDRFYATIRPGTRVLDLGCGNGMPIMAELIARDLTVVGVDFSPNQLARARARFPDVPLVEADLTEVAFVSSSFDAIIALDCIWNVPRDEHAAVFARLRDWLIPGGHALFTLGAPEEGETADTTMYGVPTYYSGWPLRVTLELLRRVGVDVVAHDLTPRALFVLVRRPLD